MSLTLGAASYFLPNLLLFGRLLRGLGLDVNPGRMMDLIQALDLIDLGRKPDFYHAARSLLVHDRDDLRLFDQAFQLFWRKPPEGWLIDLPTRAITRKSPQPIVRPPPLTAPDDQPPDPPEAPDQPPQPVVEVTVTYSDREVLRQRDFADLTGDELMAVKLLITQLIWRMDERRTRRRQPGRGRQLDLRRTLRRNLKHGGEIMAWARRQRKTKPRPVVVIADISGSMERYTRLLLHFIYGLHAGLSQPVEAFVFSTRLTRITRQLHTRSLEAALRGVSHIVSDWAGGTRIGEALKTFNFAWGRRVLGRGAVVLIISDGWDRGEPGLLAREMARLRRSCHRLIWLNPLLGSVDYQPLTRGIQAALPYVHHFLPVHNLASLEDLAGRLADLRPRR